MPATSVIGDFAFANITAAAVIFANAKSPITDVAGKKIGKEVFSKNFENLTLHHYYIEKNDYFVEGEQISPYASQW